MKIIRYSKTGFEPQYQNHHIANFYQSYLDIGGILANYTKFSLDLGKSLEQIEVEARDLVKKAQERIEFWN